MASLRFPFFASLGLLGLLSTLSAVGGLELLTIPKILTTCGENVTLRCDVTTDSALEITELSWKLSKDICTWGQSSKVAGIECMNASSTNSYNYSLTIYNVQPKHKGTYHCQLRSKQGSANGQTIVRVQKCVSNSTANVTSTNGTCIFNDVYPKPEKISWKQGNDDSIGNSATTKITENADGKFTAISTIKLRKNPSLGLYNCSLLVPTENEMNVSMVQTLRSMTFAGGDGLIAHWVSLMLAMVLGIVIVQA
ncbi:hypothetical protein NQD34_005845 [Periophthalmus magnuspinnatus]|nr:hypothetical protein NQD34_005845 [Periophthalmus magnuspinnatus]